MKKGFAAVTALCVIMCLTACGNTNTSSSEATSKASVSVSKEKPLVVYFSRVGNTDFPENVDAVSSASLNHRDGVLKGNAQLIAEWIADEIKCDTVEIVTEEKYPADYNQTVDQADGEKKQKKRPALHTKLDHIEQYDTIYFVTPNWWFDLPMPVYSFLDAYDLSGKSINVFITHEGSAFSNTINTIKELEPDAVVTEALAVRGGSVTNEEQNIRQWVREH